MANPHFQLVWIERLRLRSELGDLLIKVWRKSSRLEVGKYQRRNLPAAVDIQGRVVVLLIHVVDLQGVLRDGDAQLQPLRALLNLLRLHRHHCDVPVLRLPEMFKTYVLSNFHFQSSFIHGSKFEIALHARSEKVNHIYSFEGGPLYFDCRMVTLSSNTYLADTICTCAIRYGIIERFFLFLGGGLKAFDYQERVWVCDKPRIFSHLNFHLLRKQTYYKYVIACFHNFGCYVSFVSSSETGAKEHTWGLLLDFHKVFRRLSESLLYLLDLLDIQHLLQLLYILYLLYIHYSISLCHCIIPEYIWGRLLNLHKVSGSLFKSSWTFGGS